MMRNAAHICPVPGCGNHLPSRKSAVCRRCWGLLPFDKRQAIQTAKDDQAPHKVAAASIDATRWLTEHAPWRQAARMTGEREDLGAPP